jgi:stearoyl-CoA desaturase (delta-9 desaturase)
MTLPTSSATMNQSPARPGAAPVTEDRQTWVELTALWTYVIVPFLALLAAVPYAWGWGISWTDVAIALPFYYVSGLGITVGFHRYFTHGSFKAKRWLRVTLAVAGSLAIEGPPTRWVADHRRHHAFSDKDGDPHSPWRYGESLRGLTKGFFHAHLGWLFDVEQTSKTRFCPDLVADKDIRRVDMMFLPIVIFSTFAPAVIGGLVTMSWHGALTAFFWGSLVRIGLLHHVTWSINSVCHIVGERPFKSTDKATNFWPLAILSFGESWHNLHHADPTCARHGVMRGQLDSSARVIWAFEKLGWVRDVRWPRPERLANKRIEGTRGTVRGQKVTT